MTKWTEKADSTISSFFAAKEIDIFTYRQKIDNRYENEERGTRGPMMAGAYLKICSNLFAWEYLRASFYVRRTHARNSYCKSLRLLACSSFRLYVRTFICQSLLLSVRAMTTGPL